MKRFEAIYSWQALRKAEQGKKVCVCDRYFHSCDTLNELTVDKAIAIINDAEEHKDRYDFWIEEESEEVKNEQS